MASFYNLTGILWQKCQILINIKASETQLITISTTTTRTPRTLTKMKFIIRWIKNSKISRKTGLSGLVYMYKELRFFLWAKCAKWGFQNNTAIIFHGKRINSYSNHKRINVLARFNNIFFIWFVFHWNAYLFASGKCDWVCY